MSMMAGVFLPPVQSEVDDDGFFVVSYGDAGELFVFSGDLDGVSGGFEGGCHSLHRCGEGCGGVASVEGEEVDVVRGAFGDAVLDEGLATGEE